MRGLRGGEAFEARVGEEVVEREEMERVWVRGVVGVSDDDGMPVTVLRAARVVLAMEDMIASGNGLSAP
jgi:hypothetical protein